MNTVKHNEIEFYRPMSANAFVLRVIVQRLQPKADVPYMQKASVFLINGLSITC